MTSRPPSSADRGARRGEAVARWRAAIARVAATSRPLAARFEECTASLPGRVAPERLEAWAEAGLVVRAGAGWRGDRLAQELYAAAPRAVPLLADGDAGRWAALVLRCGAELEEVEFLRPLPSQIAGWDATLRTRWLDATLGCPTALALAAYRILPEALERVAAPSRLDLLAAWGRAAADGGAAALVRVTPLLGALLGGVPDGARAHAVGVAARVAAAFPAGVPPLLRNLPRLYDAADPARVDAWTAHGLDLAARHTQAGVAFFGLESRTSERVLAASPTAVALDEVQGVLRRLVHMLSGAPATPRASGPFHLRPPLEETAADPMVALPSAVDRLDTVEGNRRLYRLSAALVAGRRLCGTYDAFPGGTAVLRAPERPASLEGLFLLADGVRVAARLAAAFQGVGADLRWAGETLLADPVTTANVFDGLLALALCQAQPPSGVPAGLAATARLILPTLQALHDPAATAADALAVAERLAVLFPDLEGTEQGLGVLPDLVTVLLDAGAGGGVPNTGDDVGDDLAPGGPASPADDGLPAALEDALTLLVDAELGEGGGGRPLDPEALRRLLEMLGADALGQARGDVLAQAGLFVTQLVGKRLAEARPPVASDTPPQVVAGVPRRLRADASPVFLYDEWDHLIEDYRPAWCTLREVELPGDSGLYFDRALARHADLVPEVRRHFLRLRPERYRRVHGLEDGEVVDLDALVEAWVQHRVRRPASAKLYSSRRREERDVATLFLLDLSASTDETAPGSADRIVDITKDALVIMTAALEEIGDLYAVYGFSGQGREQVEVYPVKTFDERLTAAVQSRIGGLEPRGSTRMGTALRHALTRMAGVAAPSRHLVLLSDGFPQDLDYGTDRASHTYGIRDTAAALREAQRAGVRPFCITVDLAGHDYLREMCAPEQYLVIEAVADLPRELPKIYQRLIRAA